MIVVAKDEKLKEGTQKAGTQNQGSANSNKLKTDAPLSEKDEVKQAEENMRKNRRNLL
jgi:hypothetical protein